MIRSIARFYGRMAGLTFVATAITGAATAIYNPESPDNSRWKKGLDYLSTQARNVGGCKASPWQDKRALLNREPFTFVAHQLAESSICGMIWPVFYTTIAADYEPALVPHISMAKDIAGTTATRVFALKDVRFADIQAGTETVSTMISQLFD